MVDLWREGREGGSDCHDEESPTGFTMSGFDLAKI